MFIKDTVRLAIEHGFSPVPRFFDKDSGEWKLRKFIDKDTGKYGYEQSHKAWSYENMPMVSLVLQNVVLVDLDGNKDTCEASIDELKTLVCEKLCVDEFDLDMALFQTNDEADSLHYLFKLPSDITFDEIGQSNDGKLIKHVDFKVGRQLVHIKPGKTVHWLNTDDLQELSIDAVVSIFGRNKRASEHAEIKSTSVSSRYGMAALRGIENSATVFVEEGGRNAALASATVSLYELVAGGEIAEHDAVNTINTIVNELGIENESDTHTTIEYNKKKGLSQPKAATGLISADDVTSGETYLNDFDELCEKIESAETKDELQDAVFCVADLVLSDLDLTLVAKLLSKRFKLVLGETISEAKVLKLIKSNRKTTKRGDFVDGYVFMTSTGEYMDRRNKETMGPRSFDTKHNRDTPPTSEGDKQSATTYSNDVIECVNNAMYVPKFGDIFTHEDVSYINTYTKSRLKRVKQGSTDIVERVKGHIAHLLVNDDEQQLVINYLAHNVQYPGEKIQWAMVLQGVQGDGKSFLSEMMQHVLGFNNVRQMNVQTLESSFSGWAVGQCMTFIEELKLDNFRKYEVLNNLKPYITNPSIEVVKKGKDPQVVINTTNYFALTNFKDAIPIDDNDRRYCILFSQWQDSAKLCEFMRKHPTYYPDLYAAMRENAGEILDWLLSHNISDSFKEMKRAPETSAKSTMRNLSKSEAYLIVEDALAEFAGPEINDYAINVTELVKQVTNCFTGGYEDFPKTRALKNVLTDMGYHHVGVYKNAERKNQVIYCKDDTVKASEVFSDNEEFDF